MAPEASYQARRAQQILQRSDLALLQLLLQCWLGKHLTRILHWGGPMPRHQHD